MREGRRGKRTAAAASLPGTHGCATHHDVKQNLTIRLEKDLIRKAKILASKRDTSITGLLSGCLEKLLHEEDAYRAAKGKALEAIERGYSLGGKGIGRREDLHAR